MRKTHRLHLSFLSGGVLMMLCAAAVADEKAAAAAKVSPQALTFFETRIRPLLFENCFACHGEKQQSGGLRLDSRDALLKGSSAGPVFLSSDPQKSLLLHVLRYDGKVKMPPKGKLKPEQISALTEWIKMGAPWPGADPAVAAKSAGKGIITDAQRRFWAFRPVRKVTPPALSSPKAQSRFTSWAKSPIDRFILAKLLAKGLTPAPQADKRTLIRRAAYDLTGLPPTPIEVEAFLADTSPDAFAKVVDRLLASPRYGERWARHWLDVARYADSNGLDENLAFGSAWRYRDYVIAALNKDKPYDQFLTEQLAGDLLPTDDPALRNERLTATAFLALGPKVLAEQDKQKLVMDIVDEQIEVTSKAFLGLTVSCARCHDHKFDPIPTKDYYALAGIFKSTRTMQDLGFVSRVLERPLRSSEYDAQAAAHKQRVETLQAEIKTVKERANAELVAAVRRDAGKILRAGWELAQQPELLSLAETPVKPGELRLIVEAEKFDRGNFHRDFETYGKGIGVIHSVTHPNFAEWEVNVPQAGLYQIELRYAAQEARPVRLLLNGKALRDATAGQNTGSWQADGQRWELQGAYRFAAGKNTLRIERDSDIPHFDKFLIAPVTLPENAPKPRTTEEIAAQYGLPPALVRRAAEYLRGAENAPGFAAWKTALNVGTKLTAEGGGEETFIRHAQEDPKGPFRVPEKPEIYYPEPVQAALKKSEETLKAEQAKAPQPPLTLAVEDGKPENVRVHLRGNHLTLGEEAPRRFLSVLTEEKHPPIDDRRSGRLELAQWLVRPDHPLTSRVAVNRIWQGHFGFGLVRTPENFGLLGDKPSHPELLDWLARTFIEQGWSLKKLHRLIMLSAAYQMSSTTDPKAALADPENRLLWRMPRRRLEAEPFRDAMLFVSGKLEETMGGSLLATRNNDYVTNDQSGNAAQYSQNRRSIYLPIIRNALYDMFQAFDVGDPSTVNPFRPTTTVAPQALFVLNSPFALDQSRQFAFGLLGLQAASDAERVRMAYLKAFSRPPTAAETKRALNYVAQYESALTAKEADAAKRREKAWQSLCQILFASNEFIYIN